MYPKILHHETNAAYPEPITRLAGLLNHHFPLMQTAILKLESYNVNSLFEIRNVYGEISMNIIYTVT